MTMTAPVVVLTIVFACWTLVTLAAGYLLALYVFESRQPEPDVFEGLERAFAEAEASP